MGNFLKIAQMLGRFGGRFNSKNYAANAAKELTTRGTAKKYNPNQVYRRTNPEFDANIFSSKPRQSAFNRLEPYGVSYTPAEGRDIILRQQTQDKIYNNRLMRGQETLAPLFQSYGRNQLGLGIGAGAIPPSLYALYLLSKEDEQKKKNKK